MSDDFDLGAGDDEVVYDGDEPEQESGPFCPHWGDPSDCDEVCGRCGHACHKHLFGENCIQSGCECEEFIENKEPARGGS